DEAASNGERKARLVLSRHAGFQELAVVCAREVQGGRVERRSGTAPAGTGEDGDKREGRGRMLRLDCAHRRADVLAVYGDEELRSVECQVLEGDDLLRGHRLVGNDEVVDLERERLVGLVGNAAHGDGHESKLQCVHTYGGDQV